MTREELELLIITDIRDLIILRDFETQVFWTEWIKWSIESDI